MSDFVGLISAIVSILALIGSAYAWRVRELRREEVLQWGLQCIDVLQTSVLLLRAICDEGVAVNTPEARELKIRSSVLCEQGRLFFKNQNSDAFGQSKRPAYRGLRPTILDRLVVNYQLLDRLSGGDLSDVGSMARVAEDNLKFFVSLIQAEVGRGRTASPDASLGGQSINVERLIAENFTAGP